jgi:TPR repeat protein
MRAMFVVVAVAVCTLAPSAVSAETLTPCGPALPEQAAPQFEPGEMSRIDAKIEVARTMSVRDPVRARRLASEAAATGHPEAHNLLAIYTYEGVGAPADPEAGARLQEEAAARGSVGALLSIGMRCIHSDEPEHRRRGAELLSKAYERPHARGAAAAGLARVYLFGWGVSQDVQRGVELLHEAVQADPGDQLVLFLLGRAYQSGWADRDVDRGKAYEYFRRAAELGHPRSQREVGMALLEGEGVPKDGSQAFEWFKKAAIGGDVLAHIDLGAMLALGEGGIKEDDPQARHWYLEAVKMNSAYAMTSLGGMYLRGEGGPVDEATGLAFVELAAGAGDERARDLLAERQPPSDALRAEVDRIKAAWLAEHGAPE